MLRNKLSNYNLILASGSPRRQHFFKELDVPFTIEIKEVNEIYPNHLKAAEITDYLADLKSKCFTNLKSNDLLITSDTIVWFEEKALGKPKNKEEASNMLKKMSGKQHAVYTSISIKSSFFQKKLLSLILSIFGFQNGEMPNRAEGQKISIKKVRNISYLKFSSYKLILVT